MRAKADISIFGLIPGRNAELHKRDDDVKTEHAVTSQHFPMTILENHEKSVVDFNRQDAAATADAYAPDALVTDPQHPQPLRGREAVMEDYEKMFRAFSDINTSISRVMVDDDRIAYHMVLRGTHDGPLATEHGDLPPTGRRLELPAAVFAEAGPDGRYKRVNRYYDTAALLRQMGVLAGPA